MAPSRPVRRPRGRTAHPRTHLLSALGLVLVAIVILIVVLTPPDQESVDVHEREKTGDFDGWTPSYFEDFERDAPVGSFGAIYGTAWNGYNGIADTSGRGMYAPDQVLSAHDSMLDFYLHTVDGQHLVAAPLPNGYDGQTYGRFSLRFKADNIPGYKIAFMQWPESDSWNDGEIDWPEGELAGPMSPASAQVGTLRNGEMSFDTAHRVYSPTDATEWHVATTEWTPGSVKWFWDGELVGETAVAALVPTLPMRWTLQAETNLEEQLISDDTAGHILIDWVRAWTYTPGTAGN
ncbi:glycoside hydrolase family 16 protein [Glaciihabitans tibetensis]|uniref:glycoside hydrolase family 16 protein n=1 Tax=Glaciihabitans tibetensis TaxID=1266600 RepID=UPI000D078B6A|nr:glycoside hydrolase family 16 protein [Glaciihabitans tibetensis]